MDMGVGVVEIPGAVALLFQCLHLPGGHAEQEDVVPAHLFADLDIGAVQGAEGHGAVHHQLHIAGAARFGAGERDLLADIRGRHQQLREGHPVVLQVHDLQLIPDRRVGVDFPGQVADEPDDFLSQIIPRGGFRAEDIGAGGEGHVRVVLKGEIGMEDVQGIQVLAFVLVQPLDLDVEQGLRIDHDAVCPPDVVGEAFLILPLDRHEPV